MKRKGIDYRTHLKFVPGPDKPKTKTWWVVNKHDNTQIGWVTWFGRWHKYCFHASPVSTSKEITVLEEVCMRDISDFIEEKTKEHRRRR